MPRLLLFNPDTDYALASGREYYTPPAHVVQLRKRLALLPALYARPGDIILLADETDGNIDSLEYADLAKSGHIEILTIAEASERRHLLVGYTPDPWGWNRSVRRLFIDTVGEMPGMPSPERIEAIRNLSHRRTSISMLEAMSDFLDGEITLPREISDVEQAVSEFRRDSRLFFKAPWSSSGRGVILTDDLEERHVRPWLKGIVKRQGSVMMEKAYSRRLDFATEWICENGIARFIGYSVFNVSRRGKYQSNYNGCQSELLSEINRVSGQWTPEYLEAQRAALDVIVAPHYDGPLGIDMLVTDSGAINPCVELNLRHTMGMLNLI